MTENNDHLSNDISVSAEQTPTGFKLGARSRFLSAVDRLGGAALDAGSAHLEGIAQRRRAKNSGEVAIIEALAAQAISELNADPELARRAAQNHFGKMLRLQENKDGVIEYAGENLRLNPPDDSADASAELSPEFMDRIEQYAESASTEALRERWGRVLAAEVRKPGTISARAMRIVDEMDGDVARLFERVCAYRYNANAIPIALSGELTFKEIYDLVSAGLILDPAPAGHHMTISAESEDTTGKKFRVFNTLWGLIALPSSAKPSDGRIVGIAQGDFALKVYLLTDAGKAISSILPAPTPGNAEALARKLASSVSDAESVQQYAPIENDPDNGYRVIAEYPVS